MKQYQIFFVLLYVPAMLLYAYTTGKMNRKVAAANKIVCSSLFFTVSMVGFLGDSERSTKWLLLFAVFFSMVGDIVLIWDFVKGGISFLIGNLLFSWYLFMLLKKTSASFLIFYFLLLFLLLGVLLWLEKTKKIDLSKLKSFRIYMVSVISQGSLGLLLMLVSDLTKYRILGLGNLLFMISDYFLALLIFGNQHRTFFRVMNILTYFTGMMLIAIIMGC